MGTCLFGGVFLRGMLVGGANIPVSHQPEVTNYTD